MFQRFVAILLVAIAVLHGDPTHAYWMDDAARCVHSNVAKAGRLQSQVEGVD